MASDHLPSLCKPTISSLGTAECGIRPHGNGPGTYHEVDFNFSKKFCPEFGQNSRSPTLLIDSHPRVDDTHGEAFSAWFLKRSTSLTWAYLLQSNDCWSKSQLFQFVYPGRPSESFASQNRFCVSLKSQKGRPKTSGCPTRSLFSFAREHLSTAALAVTRLTCRTATLLSRRLRLCGKNFSENKRK